MKCALVLVLAVCCTQAQTNRQPVPPDRSPRRVAIVIGNDAYPGNALRNAANDARGMKRVLEKAGFAVQMHLNMAQQQMEGVIGEFTSSVKPGDVALFFFSGHG